MTRYCDSDSVPALIGTVSNAVLVKKIPGWKGRPPGSPKTLSLRDPAAPGGKFPCRPSLNIWRRPSSARSLWPQRLVKRTR
jgi:hypothetical protein